MIDRFTVETNGPGLYDISVTAFSGLPTLDGVLTVFLRHTSCSLLIQENADPDVRRDLDAFFRRFAPPSDDPSMAYLRHRAEGHDDMPAHIKAAVLPVSLPIPCKSGHPCLGT